MNVVYIDVEANHKLRVAPSYANLVECMAYSRLELLTPFAVQEYLLIALKTGALIIPHLTLESRPVVYLD